MHPGSALPRAGLLGAVAAARGVGACGGGDGGGGGTTKAATVKATATPDPAVAHRRLVDAANAICAQADAPGAAAGSSTAFDRLSDLTELHVEDAERLDGAVQHLTQLKAPPADKAAFAKLVGAMSGLAEANKQAGDAHDIAAYSDAAQSTVDAYVAVFKASQPLVVTKCPPRGATGAYNAASARMKPTGPPPAPTLQGDWAGRVEQFGPGQQTDHYRVEVSIGELVVGGEGGHITYPKFDCSGPLVVAEASEDAATFREQLDHGAKRCYGGGAKITVALKGSRLSFHWLGRSNAGTKVEVLGRLRQP
jgi:hypothetical protein